MHLGGCILKRAWRAVSFQLSGLKNCLPWRSGCCKSSDFLYSHLWLVTHICTDVFICFCDTVCMARSFWNVWKRCEWSISNINYAKASPSVSRLKDSHRKKHKKNTFGHPENQRAMSAPFFWTILNSLCKSKKQLHRVLQNVVKDATFGGTGHEEYEEIRKCKTTKKNIYIQNHQLKDVVAYSGLFHVFSMFWWFFDFEFGWRTYQAKPTLAIENSIQVCRVSSTTPPASLKQFHHW